MNEKTPEEMNFIDEVHDIVESIFEVCRLSEQDISMINITFIDGINDGISERILIEQAIRLQCELDDMDEEYYIEDFIENCGIRQKIIQAKRNNSITEIIN